MKVILRAFLILSVFILTQSSAFSFQATTDNSSRAEAERMWELMIQAKGGRERLHSVANLQRSEREKYLWWFKVITINYEGLFVFPNKSWEWDDQRGTVFGFRIHLHNFEKDFHRSYTDVGEGPSIVPILEPSRRNFTTLQLELLAETKWVRPVPYSVRSEELNGKKVDIVETNVRDLPEDKVEFALDRKTHLPVRVAYFWTRNNRQFSGGVDLKDYVDVDGIKMPSKVGRIKATYKLNVEYNPQIFELIPSREAGMDAWRKNQIFVRGQIQTQAGSGRSQTQAWNSVQPSVCGLVNTIKRNFKL